MKKLAVSMMIVLCSLQTWGQGKEYIPVAVVVPRQVDNLENAQIMRLGNITLDLATRSGMSATGQGSPVVMLPIFTIEKEDVVEGGMKNLIVISADITFVIKNLETEIIYASINSQVRGSGLNRQRAINDAISKIQVNGEDFSAFINRGRDKIMDYYRNNCSSLMIQAETFARTQQYEAAIATVASVPSVAPCHKQALGILEKFYPAYQKQQCRELYQQANALYGAHRYIDAMTILFDLNTFGTDCNKEVNALIKTVESKLSAEEQREWDLIVQRDKNRTALAEKRLEAIQAIAIAYFGRKTMDMYNLIIR